MIVSIPISPAEVQSGQISPENLAAALKAMHEDGVVVLEDVVDPEHIALLRERVTEDVQKLIARPDAPFNWNSGNVQQNPPPFPPYLFRDVMANDIAVAVAKAILGAGLKNAFYSGNTAVKSTERQPVHVDTGSLWADPAWPHPTAQIVVNLPLVDMGPENGATEIWPGTHSDCKVSIHQSIELTPEQIEARRAVRPPIQPNVRAGSIVMRDIRLWHAGMPNHTDVPRPMIALIYTPFWLYGGEPLKFPKGTEEIFANSDLRTEAIFVDEEIDHISAPSGHAYTK